MKKLMLILILGATALTLCAQINGNLQYIGDKAILHVWGSHYERGRAQGYLLGQSVLDVFDQFYYAMVVSSNPSYYNLLWNYYQEHFDTDPRLQTEAQGIIAGLQEAGLNLHHNGLARDLTADDLLQANSFLDMLLVRESFAAEPLELGCASLSSWGGATEQDSLLAGAAVITRFLDWTLYDVLMDNPLLIVHHPTEPDEQEWLSFAVPGWIGALSAATAAGTWASLNMGNTHPVIDTQGLDPVSLDLRRGLERQDYNGDGASDALDIYDALEDGNHLHGTIIHTLSEGPGGIISAVVENNNSGAVLRYPDQNGGLPANHLAATNHFRLLEYPVCCDRYANLQDSLYADSSMTAKRQWRVLSGAAGQQTNLAAIQFTPSTGYLLWSGASSSLPAYQSPALSLNAQTLFDYNVSLPDETHTPSLPKISCYPNPLISGGFLKLKSSQPILGLSLYNLRGQKVLTPAIATLSQDIELALPELQPGIYFLRLSLPAGRQSTRRLVLVR